MLMECGASNCHFPSCGNRFFSDAEAGGLDHLTEVFWTGPSKGFGLRATQELRKNQLVAEYLGEIVSQSSISNWRYIMSLPQGFAIDASMAGGPARFINHSCEPNCNAQRWLVEGGSASLALSRRWRVGIFAKRDILSGEELTFSYSNRCRWPGKGGFGSSDPCHCGADGCSGRIAEPPKKCQPKRHAAIDGNAIQAPNMLKSRKFGLIKRPKGRGGDFQQSEMSGVLQRPDRSDSVICTNSEETCKCSGPPSTTSLEAQLPLLTGDWTEVEKVNDDEGVSTRIGESPSVSTVEILELSDDPPQPGEDAEDGSEEETLQDLLSAAQRSDAKMEDAPVARPLSCHEAPQAKKLMERQGPGDQEQITALSLGLYLPSALCRAREFFCTP
eukprot:Skav214934  [mRNA]  locus=scaffold3017:80258:81903:- [translate_table: standard]